MRHLLNDFLMLFVLGVLAVVSLGLLIAAAVAGFAEVVGVAGALGIVGGGLLVITLVALGALQSRQRRRASIRRTASADIGGVVAAFMLGVWDGLSERRKD